MTRQIMVRIIFQVRLYFSTKSPTENSDTQMKYVFSTMYWYMTVHNSTQPLNKAIKKRGRTHIKCTFIFQLRIHSYIRVGAKSIPRTKTVWTQNITRTKTVRPQSKNLRYFNRLFIWASIIELSFAQKYFHLFEYHTWAIYIWALINELWLGSTKFSFKCKTRASLWTPKTSPI